MAVGYSSGGRHALARLNTTQRAEPLGFSANRAFIQFAGFTFGLTQSFYDFYSQRRRRSSAANQSGGRHRRRRQVRGCLHRAVRRRPVGHVSAEARRDIGVFNTGSTTIRCRRHHATPAALILGFVRPPRRQKVPSGRTSSPPYVSTAWGSAQIMGAFHDASGQYYYGHNTLHCKPLRQSQQCCGLAVGGGFKWFAPMIGHGDYFQLRGQLRARRQRLRFRR